MEQIILFEESKKLSAWILWLFTIPYLLFLYGVVQQIFYHVPLGSKPASDTHLIFFTCTYLAFLLLLNTVKWKLRVTKAGFYLSLSPFNTGDLHRWSNVREIRIEKYNSLQEYLGIGYRSRSSSMMYLAGGNPGIKIRLHNGDKLLIAARDQAMLIQILTNLQVITPHSEDLPNFK